MLRCPEDDKPRNPRNPETGLQIDQDYRYDKVRWHLFFFVDRQPLYLFSSTYLFSSISGCLVSQLRDIFLIFFFLDSCYIWSSGLTLLTLYFLWCSNEINLWIKKFCFESSYVVKDMEDRTDNIQVVVRIRGINQARFTFIFCHVIIYFHGCVTWFAVWKNEGWNMLRESNRWWKRSSSEEGTRCSNLQVHKLFS